MYVKSFRSWKWIIDDRIKRLQYIQNNFNNSLLVNNHILIIIILL